MPKYTHDMVENFLNGNIELATKMQLDAIPLINALFSEVNPIPLINSLFSEVNPIPVKSALNMIGYNYGVPRLPLTKMTEKKEEILKNELFKLMK